MTKINFSNDKVQTVETEVLTVYYCGLDPKPLICFEENNNILYENKA